MMDWLAKMLKLPEHFLNSDPGPGAGIIQSTASDASLVALLAARARAVERSGKVDMTASWAESFWNNGLVNKGWKLLQKHSVSYRGEHGGARHSSDCYLDPEKESIALIPDWLGWD